MKNLNQELADVSLENPDTSSFLSPAIGALAFLAITATYAFAVHQAEAFTESVLEFGAQQGQCVASSNTSTVSSDSSKTSMVRDPAAEQAVIEAMHQLHAAFDAADVDAISKFIADDDFLFVYELDPNGQPLKLNSKAELLTWLRGIFKDFKQENATTQAKNPVMTACGDTNFVMVTEECRLKIRLPGNQVRLERLRATAVARRKADGWKFIHWHMSPAAPITVLDSSQAASIE
jgi:ketosteroid isomerase-like protein